MAIELRLGAQSVTLLSTLRDPTQLRRRQCATRQQHPFFVAHQKEGIGQPKKVQHHIGGNPLNSRKLFLAASCTFLGSIYSFLLMSNKNLSFLLSNIT